METQYAQVSASPMPGSIVDTAELVARLIRLQYLAQLFSQMRTAKSPMALLGPVILGIMGSIFFLTIISVTLELLSGWLRLTSVFYWLTLLTRRRLNNGNLFTVLSSVVLVEVASQLTCPAYISTIPILTKLFATFTACLFIIPSAVVFGLLSTDCAIQLVVFTSFIHSLTPQSNVGTWSRLISLLASCFGGIVLARCTETLIATSLCVASADGKSVSAWKRRHSSPRRLQRRGSFPSLPGSTATRSFSFHGNPVSAEGTLLAAAHGLVSDLLSDPSALPAKAVGNLRAVAYLLAPPTPTSVRAKPFPPVSLVEVNRSSLTDSEEIPFVNERTSAFAKVGPFVIFLSPKTATYSVLPHSTLPSFIHFPFPFSPCPCVRYLTFSFHPFFPNSFVVTQTHSLPLSLSLLHSHLPNHRMYCTLHPCECPCCCCLCCHKMNNNNYFRFRSSKK